MEHLKFSNLILKNSITSNLLYYSWINLKNNRDNVFDLTFKSNIEPLSKYWFEKTSFLIRSGNYLYSNKDNLLSSDRNVNFSNKISSSSVKDKIVENAFLILLKLFFSTSFNSKNINLTECVRLYIE